MTQHKFTVTAARGMLPLLAQELNAIGIKQTKQEQGNIRFTGSLEDAYRVCLWSRVAIRVLLPIKHLPAATTDELYDGIKNIAWEDHIAQADTTIAVDFNSFRSKIKHSQYGAQRVKDGIVDRLREINGERPSVDLYQPDVRINVYVKHNQATVSIDLSGESLHKRGYRIETTQAPLKEHLAAATLMTSEWPNLAAQGWALLDPMCGSGTFLIEAAMIAADIAPSINRDYFGFLYWKQHDKESWQRLKAEAERRRHSGLARLPIITGGDQDQTAVAAAKANIAEAGLADRIKVEHKALLDWPAQAENLPETGLVVCNPPYGERIGDRDNLSHLYESLGNVINETLPFWRTSLITDNANLGKLTGLTLFDSAPFDNGPIACELLQYRAPRRKTKTQQALTVKNAASVSQQEYTTELVLSENAEMFANRLTKNLKHIRKWARKNDISCYRVYDADLPDYAVAIDLYDDHAHVQEYAPPKSIDPQKAVQRLNDVMQSLPKLLNIPAANIALKLRKKQRGTEQYRAHGAQKQRFQVTESGLSFWVNLTDYLDTGLFLDHRITRQMLMSDAAGKDFLNLFAYTGSGTVYAAAGGAASTTTVDMSNTYLEWAKDNMAANGFTQDSHRFERANCVEWLQQAQQKQQRYDLIFLDPPTFSNSSRMEDVFDIQRDHVSLIKAAAKLLTAQGAIYFSTNNRQFKLDTTALSAMQISDISKKTLPNDFERNTKIHYCWHLKNN
jgi:23S rRNA (guanine2445-N2)-methyltransferase / 23S rRNA (guanine2069-N7)-methyltransferase